MQATAEVDATCRVAQYESAGCQSADAFRPDDANIDASSAMRSLSRALTWTSQDHSIEPRTNLKVQLSQLARRSPERRVQASWSCRPPRGDCGGEQGARSRSTSPRTGLTYYVLPDGRLSCPLETALVILCVIS